MAKAKKLSVSKASGKCFKSKSKPLSAATATKLSTASKLAGERISHNNQVYAASNSHASYYATK